MNDNKINENTDNQWIIDSPNLCIRLDKFLGMQWQAISRQKIQNMIKSGLIHINGKPCTKKNTILSLNNSIMCTDKVILGQVLSNQDQEDFKIEPINQPLNIVFEDDHFMVIVKPSGLVVHPGSGQEKDSVVARVAHYLAKENKEYKGDFLSIGDDSTRPGVVHRLDKDTSGLMIIAKTNEIVPLFIDMFKKHDIHRQYLALSLGFWPYTDDMVIDAPIARHPKSRKKFTAIIEKSQQEIDKWLEHNPLPKHHNRKRKGALRQVPTHMQKTKDDRGKHAVTIVHLEHRLGQWASLLKCHLETGRTHQIRVHLQSSGFPVLGDPVYTRMSKERLLHMPKEHMDDIRAINKQCLHAFQLDLEHPITGAPLSFQSFDHSFLKEYNFLNLGDVAKKLAIQ